MLISWEIEAANEGGTVHRIFHRRGDSRNQDGDQGGEADIIKIVALSDTLLLTAVRSSSDNLKLISWRLQPNGELSRLGDSGEQAGVVREISLTAIGPDSVANHRVVTSVRDIIQGNRGRRDEFAAIVHREN